MEDADLRCLEIEQNYVDIAKILRRFVENVSKMQNVNTNPLFCREGVSIPLLLMRHLSCQL